MRTYLRMFTYLRPYRAKLIYFFACSVGFALFMALPALLIDDFLRNILTLNNKDVLYHLAGMFLACVGWRPVPCAM